MVLHLHLDDVGAMMAHYSIRWYSHIGPYKDREAIASTSAGARKAVGKVVLDIFPPEQDTASNGHYDNRVKLQHWLYALEGFKPSKVPGMCKDFEYLVPHVGTLKITIYRTAKDGSVDR